MQRDVFVAPVDRRIFAYGHLALLYQNYKTQPGPKRHCRRRLPQWPKAHKRVGRRYPRLYEKGRRGLFGNFPSAMPRWSFLTVPTLWNSVEKSEKSRNAQLVRKYVQNVFVSAGMCADYSIHDKGDGNPHAHIMLTLRPLNECGEWGAKCRKEYDLDARGQRILLTRRQVQKPPGQHHRLERSG